MAHFKSHLSRVLAALALAAAPASAFAGKANDTLTYASDVEPENVGPYHNNVREGVIIARHVFDNLIFHDLKTGKYEPQLATEWTWTDPQTLDLTIRKGVTFHNGDPLTADDVVFTLNWAVKPESKVVTKQNVAWIKSAEKIGDDKVRIHLVGPFPAAIEYLSGPVVIYPKAYFEKVGLDGFAKAPIGSGPYKVTSVVPGKGVKMEKNTNYWKGSPLGTPSLGKLEFRLIPDPETQVAELMTGGVDWIWRVPADQAKQLESVPNLSVLAAETMRVGFLQLDAQGRAPGSAPLKDVRVRQAIAHAIDRKAMVDNLVRGGARLMNSACFIDQFGCTDKGVPRYDYDPAKAKKLLAEAGYPDGFAIEFYAYREREYAEAVVGYLRAIGIKANLNYMKYAALRELARAGKVPIFYQTWASFSVADASAFTGAWFKGDEDDLTRDPKLTQLLKTADTTVETDARLKTYEEALKLVGENAYVVPLFSYSTNYAFTNELSFSAQPDELPRFFQAKWK
ncbi:ABC transporter substrate-binding protein [Azorhizobium oxalatiphilum]|uniref:ABC transporter substrate-binding protein n=1 Tax=Azorhizobium oxalatiphilum TaxID=980631 RepID=A0A917F5Q9_9HYPH|nr:ABC transporter substrate-binding protein [Azorhizobium oxalatiphilum]GGF49228.1 ABC transporter substrate-binding protein [Azorhizobium oxalatiphilum]